MRSVLFLVVALAACATSSSSTPGKSASSEPRKICREETTTGSNISHTVCRTPEEAEAERRAAQSLHSDPRPTSPDPFTHN